MKNIFVKKIVGAVVDKRHTLQLSQKEVAQRAGISVSSVSRLERGDVSVRMRTASRILAAVGAKITIS